MTNINWPIDKADRQDYTVKSIRTDGQGCEAPSYLKENVAAALTLGLADVVKKKPKDPIEHLAHFLYKFQNNKIMKAQDEEEQMNLKIEQAQYEEELALKSMRLQEQSRLEAIERQKEKTRIRKLEEELEYALQERQRQINEEMQSEFEQIQRLKHEFLQRESDKQLLDDLLASGADLQHLKLAFQGDQRSIDKIEGEKEIEDEVQKQRMQIHKYVKKVISDEQKRLKEMERIRKLEEELEDASPERKREIEEEIRKSKEAERIRKLEEELTAISPERQREIEEEMRKSKETERIRKLEEELAALSPERQREIEEQIRSEMKHNQRDQDRQAKDELELKDEPETKEGGGMAAERKASVEEGNKEIHSNVQDADQDPFRQNTFMRQSSTFTKSKSL